ncbi:MAG: hypothetical protein F4X87_12425 [Chloroflexi bacterium]|nr:hypothetical protein [Chloroflexota bacterium]MYE27992.1 hypothetical protein [Chloroflexota bacterium]
MSIEATDFNTNQPETLEGRVSQLELRVSRVEDTIHTILENTIHLTRVQDEMRNSLDEIRDEQTSMRQTLEQHSVLLTKIAERLDIDTESP